MPELPFVEHPPQALLRWVLDALVMVPVALSSIGYLIHDDPHPRGLAVAVAVAMTAPLLVRRRWPGAVFGWLFLVAAVFGLWNVGLVASLALVVALYTIASRQSRRRALVAAALLELGVVAAAIRLDGIRPTTSDWWHAAIMGSGLVAAALGLGLYAATRQAYLNQLHERAERLERERDQRNVLAAAAERARITDEMHDILAHHLSVIIALSDGAAATSVAAPSKAAEVMRTVSATGRLALADTRRLLAGPAQDDRHGSAPPPVPDLRSLDDLIARVRAAGLPVTYEVHGPPDEVGSGVQLTVYRLVQEALTNTLKHAGPGAVAVVELRYRPDELCIEVVDTGVGANAARADGAGHGLIGMRHRVEAFGGEVETGPRSPSGWRVSARFPVEAAAEPTSAHPPVASSPALRAPESSAATSNAVTSSAVTSSAVPSSAVTSNAVT